MSFYQFQFKKQESANLCLSKSNSRKYLSFPKHNSYAENTKLSKNKSLPKIYTLGKNELNTKTVFEDNENYINPKFQKIKLIKRSSFRTNMDKPLNYINVNLKKYIKKINNDIENKGNDLIDFPKSLKKQEINLKRIKQNLISKNYPLLNNDLKIYSKNNRINSLSNINPLKYKNSFNLKKLIISHKMKIPKINSYIHKGNEIISKKEIKEDNKEKDIKQIKVKTEEYNESNSFLNEIKDIIRVCVTPNKNKDKNSKDE